MKVVGAQNRTRNPAAIGYVCRRRDHQARERRFTLTLHEGRWAYCASGTAPSHTHDWVPTGGATLAELTRSARDSAR